MIVKELLGEGEGGAHLLEKKHKLNKGGKKILMLKGAF